VPQTRRQPQRTCVICRSTTDKRELVRIVRTPAGDVVIDTSGKANGRGAYLCRQPQCWEQAIKRERLAAALKTKIEKEAREQLMAFAQTLKEAAPAGAE
jgi:predicted RNA-binding protein YlxR (DUF448 family)